jgi:hypothetical protein
MGPGRPAPISGEAGGEADVEDGLFQVAQHVSMAPGRDEGLLRGVGGVGRIAQDGERSFIHGIDPSAY